MKRIGYIVVIGGLVVGAGVLANDDFDVDHTGTVDLPSQEITVPGNDEGVSDELMDRYQAALEEAQRTGNPSLVQQLMENKGLGTEPSTALPAVSPTVNASDLPFSLLGKDLDRDQDGMSDGDEIMVLTNPSNPDTDGDGYVDGLEVVKGYNPLLAGPGDKIEYAEPELPDDAIYKITGIRLGGIGAAERLTVTGTGPNYSLIALLVRGDTNRLWVTRTDKTGRFINVSGDSLDPGTYKVYAAAVSADGISMASSQPLMFERTVDALVKIEPTPALVKNDEANPNQQLPTAKIIGGAVGVVVVLATGAWLWLIMRRRKAKQVSQLPLT